MANDAVQLVAALGGGELITYIPFGGVAKSVNAMVDRKQPESSSFGGATYPENSIVVTIAKDAVNGVMSVAKGKDRVSMKLREWDSDEKEMTIVAIEDQPSAFPGGLGDMWVLVVK